MLGFTLLSLAASPVLSIPERALGEAGSADSSVLSGFEAVADRGSAGIHLLPVAPPAFGIAWIVAAAVFLLALLAAMICCLRVGARTRRRLQRLTTEQLERARVADELQEALLQSVQGLIVLFTAATALVVEDSPPRRLMERALDRADEILISARDRLADSRARADARFGLGRALTSIAEEFSALGRASFLASVECDETRVRPDIAGSCYHIAREALLNTLRHSDASSAFVSLKCESKGLYLSVSDDGRGIDDVVLASGRPGHRGLDAMRSRAEQIGATLTISSGPATGTVVGLFVPASTAFKRRSGLREWFRRTTA